MGMIVDSFIFNDEIDILELRLNIIGDYVDRIVIVESDHTFTNIPKKYNFLDHAHRFNKWANKIRYYSVASPQHENSWANESWSRDQLQLGWKDLTDNDIILISDVDEIYRPSVIELISKTNFKYYGLIMPVSYYKFNYVDVESDKLGYVAWGGAFRGFQNYTPHKMRKFNEYANPNVYIHHSGWHFSWMGDTNYMFNKMKSFSHTEFNKPPYTDYLSKIDILIANRIDHIDQSRRKYDVVKLDNYFPEYLINNQLKYSNFILPYNENSKSVTDYYTFKQLQLI